MCQKNAWMFLCNGKESQQFQIPYLKLKAVRKISELKIFFARDFNTRLNMVTLVYILNGKGNVEDFLNHIFLLVLLYLKREEC